MNHQSLWLRSLPYIVYPGMTTGGVVFAFWAIAHDWPAWSVGVVAMVVATILVELLERVIPYSERWCTPLRERSTDFLHFLFSNRAFDIGILVAIFLSAPVGGWISDRLGMSLWPHHWPLLVQTVMAMLLFELPWYLVHRFEHSSSLLWRVHAVHHSSTTIYWWNFARNHPFDNLASAFVSIIPLTVLGVGQEPLAVMAAFSAAHGLLQHSNIDLRTGFLDYIFATARIHRWHHAPDRVDCHVNFSPRFMLWDHLFGTFYHRPDEKPREDVGLGPGLEDFPQGFVAQMAIPFRRRYWRKER